MPRFLLGGILVIALTLRLWRICWGLSDGMAFPDEYLLWDFEAFIPPRLDSFFRTLLFYPTLYGYLAGVAAALSYSVGIVTDDPPGRLYGAIGVARIVSALAGGGTVFLVYLLGRRFYSQSVGLVAAAFMAVTPLSAMQTHYASVDVLLEATTTLALLATCILAVSPSPTSALCAGLAAGLAFSTKYTGGQTILLPVATVLVLGATRLSRLRSFTLLTWIGVAFALTICVTCPPCVLRHQLMLSQIFRHADIVSGSSVLFRNNIVPESLGWYGRPYIFQLVAILPYALGWGLYLSSLAGLVLALTNRKPVDLLLLLHIGSYLALSASSAVAFPRYMIPILPSLCLLAARFVVTRETKASAAAIGVVFMYTLTLTTSQVDRFSYEQQKEISRWMRDEAVAIAPSRAPVCGIPVGSDRLKAAKMLTKYFGLIEPMRENGIETKALTVSSWIDAPVDFLVMPDWLAISAYRDEPQGAMVEQLERLVSPDSPFSPGPTWSSGFFSSSLYTILDPAFSADLWQGQLGFRTYIRVRPPESEPVKSRRAPS